MKHRLRELSVASRVSSSCTRRISSKWRLPVFLCEITPFSPDSPLSLPPQGQCRSASLWSFQGEENSKCSCRSLSRTQALESAVGDSPGYHPIKKQTQKEIFTMMEARSYVKKYWSSDLLCTNIIAITPLCLSWCKMLNQKICIMQGIFISRCDIFVKEGHWQENKTRNIFF